jgi:hypothetical protein
VSSSRFRFLKRAQPFFVSLLSVLVGCAAPAHSDKMVVYVEPAAPAVLRGTVTVADVTGSGDVNSLAHSKVGEAELREAVQRSLEFTGYLSANAATATHRLTVRLLGLNNSDAPGGLMVTSRIRYVLLGRDANAPALDQIVSARCVVGVAESPLASARLQQATECSVGKNIHALLWRLRTQALVPPLRAHDAASMSAEETSARVRTAVALPATVLARDYLEKLYATHLMAIARAGGRVVIARRDGPPTTITKENVDAYAEGYADTLAFVHAEAIRRRGFQQIAGTFAVKTGSSCERIGSVLTSIGSSSRDSTKPWGFHDGSAWIEQREHAVVIDTGDRDVNEGLIIENTIALMHATSGPEGWLFGSVAGDGRIELNIGRCAVTLTRRAAAR